MNRTGLTRFVIGDNYRHSPSPKGRGMYRVAQIYTSFSLWEKGNEKKPTLAKNWMRAKGFTLIETIVAISLFSIILIASGSFLSGFVRSFKLTANKSNSIQNKQLVSRNIVRDARFASKIQITNKTIELIKKDFTISYTYKNNKVLRKENNYSAYITNDYEIKTLDFSLVNPRLLKVSMDNLTTEVFCRNE